MVQIIEQTNEEKVQMYMKCTKKELTQMLIECNTQMEASIKNCNITDVTTSYTYLVHYKYPQGGWWNEKIDIVSFEDINDVTIENMTIKVSGRKYSDHVITDVRRL